MSSDQIRPFALFALVTSITAGPNNVMLTAIGVMLFLACVPSRLVWLGFGAAHQRLLPPCSGCCCARSTWRWRCCWSAR